MPPAILHFIKALDQVLNSNTFLIHFSLDRNLPLFDQVQNQILSGELKKQLLTQDLERWGNYQRQLLKEGELGELVKNPISLNGHKIAKEDQIEYLCCMLTTENKYRFFQSPYNKAKTPEQAQKLVLDFLDSLMEKQYWKLYHINTDFLYSRDEAQTRKAQGIPTMSYFSDLFGDAALLLLRADYQAFLLLCNGSD